MKMLIVFMIASLAFALAGCADRESPSKATSEIVGKLISETMVRETEQQAFEQLEALGTEGVPYLVGHLDDFRILPESRIRLENKSPKAFEKFRHYGPVTVHDALTAILNQLTGERFEVVYNGASDEVRRKNTTAWRLWCATRFPDKSAICNGAVQ